MATPLKQTRYLGAIALQRWSDTFVFKPERNRHTAKKTATDYRSNQTMNKIRSEAINAVVLAALGFGGWTYILAVLWAAFQTRTVIA